MKQGLGILIAVGAAFVFGFYPAATRAVYAAGANPSFIILFTTFWRMASLVGFVLWKRRPLFVKVKSTKIAFVGGALQAGSLATILGAMLFLPGPVVITTMFSYVALIYLYMVARGAEKFDVWVFASVVLALFGLALVLDVFNTQADFGFVGVSITVASAVITAIRVYVFGAIMKDRNPAVVGAETFVFALLFVLLGAVFVWPVLPADLSGWGWACLAAVSMSLGSFGLFYGISLLGPFKFAFYAKLEPVFGAIIAALAIGEVLGLWQYIGMLIVVGSLVLYQFFQGKKVGS